MPKFDDNESLGSQSKGRRCWNCFKPHLLVVSLIASMAIGIILGASLRELDPPMTPKQIHYFSFPGELLLRMLKMLILPLVVSSLISGLAALPAKAAGRMGLRAVLYYMGTTLLAVILGIILVVSIQPGVRGSGSSIRKVGQAKATDPVDSLLDLVRNMFPNNIVEACFKQSVTDSFRYSYKVENTVLFTKKNVTDPDNWKNTPPDNQTAMDMKFMEMYNSIDPKAFENNMNISDVKMMRDVKEVDGMNVTDVSWYVELPKVSKGWKLEKKDGMNVLGLVVFSIAFGIVISQMGPAGKPMVDFFQSMNDAIMKLVSLVIWYSPIGLLFLVGGKVLGMEDIVVVLESLGYYSITVLAGLAIHGFITLPLIYFIATRKNPFKFMWGVLQALVTALGTASSSATMPVTMTCLEENNHIDKRAVGFVIPVGATINMDGTALYEAVAAIFIAQFTGFDLDIGQIITISITATAASIGAAGVPQAGLVTMAIVLTAVGLPFDNIELIIAIDWFLDRFRTMINVLGDSFGAGIVGHLSRKELAESDKDELELPDNVNGHLKAKNGQINDGYVVEADGPQNTQL